MNNIRNNLQKFKLITFDITDTLLTFKVPPAIQYASVAAKYGYSEYVNFDKLISNYRFTLNSMKEKYPIYGKYNNITWQEWWHQVIIQILNRSMSRPDNPRKSIPAIADEYKITNEIIEMYKTEECWVKFDNVDKLLTEIRINAKIIGVISNFDPRLSEILKNLQLIDKFDFLITSYEVGIEKPNKGIFDKALEIANSVSDTEQALHIGNSSYYDYFGARMSGWHSILITVESDHHRDMKKQPDVNPNHRFNSISEFLKILKFGQIDWSN